MIEDKDCSNQAGVAKVRFLKKYTQQKWPGLTEISACFFILVSSGSYAQTASPPGPPPPPLSASMGQFENWLKQNGYAGGPGPIVSEPAKNNLLSPPPLGTKVKTLPVIVKRPPANKKVYTARPPQTFEEERAAMREAVPPTQRIPDRDSIVAFNTMLQQNMPLTPQQIVQLRQQIDTAQRASSVSPNVPPKPVSTTLIVNLEPGATPPAIRLAQGYVSSLVFVDSTGAPWPIASFDIGHPQAMNIQWDGKSNILLLQAVLPYSDGNMVIRLLGLPTPITLELVSGQRVVDYRVDIHVPGIGPNTKDLPVGTPLPDSANQLLLGVLDGVAPAGSRLLHVQGADAQAWLLRQKLYLRTRLTVLSPGWFGKMVSPDGMNAYELPKTSSVLVSRYGEPTELRIEGF